MGSCSRDGAPQDDDPRDYHPRDYDLVAFDVDGTLVGSDDGKVVWNLFNERFSGDPEVEGRFARFRAGEISYEEWVALDVGDWVAWGVTREELAAVIRAELHLMPGVAGALSELARRGYRLAVISGTLDITLSELLAGQPFDAVFTNRLWFDEQGRIERWRATPYDNVGKATALRQVAEDLGVAASRVAYVGDNTNDLAAMEAAGLAVAYEPKANEVREAADAVIIGDMRQLLAILEPE